MHLVDRYQVGSQMEGILIFNRGYMCLLTAHTITLNPTGKSWIILNLRLNLPLYFSIYNNFFIPKRSKIYSFHFPYFNIGTPRDTAMASAQGI